MKATIVRLAAAFALGAALLPAALAQSGPPSSWGVDAAKSSITAVSRQMNVPVEGKFRKFSAQVNFDPARLVEARAQVEIDIASFDLGADEFNRETVKKEWFDATRFPKATFVTSAIRATAPGRYDAAGKLTIKGVTADVVAPVTFKTEGTLPIQRLKFNIGEGEWKDTSTVADEVQIKFRIVTAKK